MPSGVFYLYWDCLKCGTKKIRGDNQKCPQCGNEREMACYEVEGEPDITDSDELAAALAGPDWTCSSCDAVNSATDSVCKDCGSARERGNRHKVVTYEGPVPRRPETLQALEEDRSGESLPHTEVYPPVASFVSGEPERKRRHEQFAGYSTNPQHQRLIKPIGIVAVVIALVALAYLVLRPYKVDVTVSGFTWDRSVTLQKYVWVGESSLSGFPAESRNQDKRWEVIGSHQEVSGSHIEYDRQCHPEQSGESCTTTDLGNGRASRSCSPNYEEVCIDVPHPVTDYRTVDDYGYRYYYEIQRWVYSRTPKAHGTDRSPYWPDFILAGDPEREKEVGRGEQYVILYLDGDDKQYARDVSYNEWKDYDARAHYLLELNGLGTILGIEKMAPQ